MQQQIKSPLIADFRFTCLLLLFRPPTATTTVYQRLLPPIRHIQRLSTRFHCRLLAISWSLISWSLTLSWFLFSAPCSLLVPCYFLVPFLGSLSWFLALLAPFLVPFSAPSLLPWTNNTQWTHSSPSNKTPPRSTKCGAFTAKTMNFSANPRPWISNIPFPRHTSIPRCCHVAPPFLKDCRQGKASRKCIWTTRVTCRKT